MTPTTDDLKKFCEVVTATGLDHISYTDYPADKGKEETHITVGHLAPNAWKETRGQLEIALVKAWVDAGRPEAAPDIREVFANFKNVDIVLGDHETQVRADQLNRPKVVEELGIGDRVRVFEGHIVYAGRPAMIIPGGEDVTSKVHANTHVAFLDQPGEEGWILRGALELTHRAHFMPPKLTPEDEPQFQTGDRELLQSLLRLEYGSQTPKPLLETWSELTGRFGGKSALEIAAIWMERAEIAPPTITLKPIAAPALALSARSEAGRGLSI